MVTSYFYEQDTLILRGLESVQTLQVAKSLALCVFLNEGIVLDVSSEMGGLAFVEKFEVGFLASKWFTNWCLLYRVEEETKNYKRAYLRA